MKSVESGTGRQNEATQLRIMHTEKAGVADHHTSSTNVAPYVAASGDGRWKVDDRDDDAE